ncbi:MAG: diguanylate cyclase [Chloroflexi bacterium]|nr:diguanylate cyclase [Chloroflexota bacterium]
MPSINPIARLSLGLTALMVSIVLLLSILDVIPDRQKALNTMRQRISEHLGVQVALILQRGDLAELGNLLTALKRHETDIQSLALRKVDGTLVAQVGEHALNWQPQDEEQSDADNIRVSLQANKQPWGNLELSFRPSTPTTLKAWLNNQLVIMLLLFGGGSFIVFYLYLRRALFYLDPTSAVPERVRRAFDSLHEGILILDQSGRIMLTNAAFKRLHPSAKEDLVGRDITQQKWLLAGLKPDAVERPWTQAMTAGKEVEGVLLDVMQPNGDRLNTVMNISPVQAPNGELRGCLISIDNVSELHHANEKLLQLVAELNETRDEVDKRNKELKLLASRDPLTGCFNRRFMFERMEELYVEVQSAGLTFCCIMADIDHFKSFNDRYGHAVGDEVIRAVVRCLQSGLRQHDMLFRYGGEEFCILLPDIPLAQAQEVAERLRVAVEQHAGRSLRSHDVCVTSSFGVAELDHSMLDPAELVGRADEALYQSKRNGRNRVTAWQRETAAVA